MLHDASAGQDGEMTDWMGEGDTDTGTVDQSEFVALFLSKTKSHAIATLPELQETNCTGSSTSAKCLRMKDQKCTWDGCSFFSPIEATLREHLAEHGASVKLLLAFPGKCLWHGCTSKASFQNANAYDHHLLNIHTDPLTCEEHGCTHKKPFRNKHDLGRHVATKHSQVRKYSCPYKSCEAEEKDFARKDKLYLHIKNTEHINDAFCPSHHCRLDQMQHAKPFETRVDILRHFNQNHGEQLHGRPQFRCALGACSQYSYHWGYFALEGHLTECHNIGSGRAWEISSNLGKQGKYVFEAGDINNLLFFDGTSPKDVQWHDCNLCAQYN
ncbi:hypothetical protein BP6252_00709 [Coleophoma cylindrospora]|uniref:C2H2-type domain-containing protein n=1 Tax=Coleophoma cylindrospora TaxID=1849047 RepID=A0A3D8SQV7_9HELO|nr:hypothetical protein BP6252_00709 [Coleophoma cylindrospora]